VVGCREWVKGRIVGHVDFEGRGSVARGVICVSAGHVKKHHDKNSDGCEVGCRAPRSQGRRRTK